MSAFPYDPADCFKYKGPRKTPSAKRTPPPAVSAEREAHEDHQDTGAITRPLASPSSTGHEVTSAPTTATEK